jgi:serine/threonine protein kinase
MDHAVSITWSGSAGAKKPMSDSLPGGQRLPQSLGKYPVLGQLGKGAMGVVYKSFDPVIRRSVALKTIRKELLADEEEAAAFGARFRNEAQAAGALLHPGIVTVYEYGEDAQYAFIAMEYVEGSSLRQYFERKVRFEERDLVSIMAQLLEALQYAHDQGVWHRDIKPANIIIMNNGRIKVADFGIARVGSSTLTQVGAVMGTPGFIAPEQYLGREVDHRVDIFAAGVVFYELLTGETPFSGSKEGVMYKVCHETVQPPSVVAGKPALARFDAVALRALAKRPQERYPNAEKFRTDLLAAYDQPISPTVAEETLIRDVGRVNDSGDPSQPRSGSRKSSRTPAWPGTPGRGQASTMPTQMLVAAGWNVDELALVERSLAHFLGPIAGVMVRRAAREARDFASLVNTLSEHLPLPADRSKFLQQNAKLAASGTGPSQLAQAVDDDATIIPGNNVRPPVAPGPSADEIARATRLLAVHVGPIAQLLVRQAAQPGTSRAAFLARLAGRLSEEDKHRFLSEFGPSLAQIADSNASVIAGCGPTSSAARQVTAEEVAISGQPAGQPAAEAKGDRPRASPTATGTMPPGASSSADEHTIIVKRQAADVVPGGPEVVDQRSDATLLLVRGSASAECFPAYEGVLTVVKSDQSAWVGRQFAILETPLVLGRSSASCLVLPDPSWSREHARLERCDAGYVLSDAGSSNGTYVNGYRLQANRPYPLHPGSMIRIGSTILAFSLRGEELPNLCGCQIAGKYFLKERLHSSPKGAVYRGHKLPNGDILVAVKLLSPLYARYPGHRQRFAAEAQVASSLRHPHICQLDDYGQAQITGEGGLLEIPFVAYDMMDGGSLTDCLPDLGNTSTEVISRWIRQIGEALAHAHRNDVIHNNLKPSSICFDRSLNAYLTDFGIAGRANAQMDLLGAPAFIAPELWGGAPPTAHSDQYSLAVLAYLMLSGTRPYNGQEDPEIREKNLRRAPAPLHLEARERQRRMLPDAVTDVVNRALHCHPERRYEGVDAFAEELIRSLKRISGAPNAKPVFFSYQRRLGAGWATHFAQQLEDKYGVGVFIDTRAVDGTAKFPAQIESAIKNCAVFVCILGEETLNSDWVRQEIAIAHRYHKQMIPVLQEGFLAPVDIDDPAIAELLQYQGVRLLDRQNIYVPQAVTDLAQRAKDAIARYEAQAGNAETREIDMNG